MLSAPDKSSDPSCVATIAASDKRIGKSYQWTNTARENGAWLPDDDDSLTSRFGKWTELPINASTRATMYETCEIKSIKERAAMRRDLCYGSGFATTTLISGVVKDSVRSIFDAAGSIGSKLRKLGIMSRKIEHFEDAPTSFLTLDCDNLDLRLVPGTSPGKDKNNKARDAHVIEQISELPEFFTEVLDASGLDFLISNCVIQYSSRFALLDTYTFKAHIEWKLSKPLTLAQQMSVAEYCNRATEKAGFGRIFDTSIYHAGRYLFSRPAELTKRVWVEGAGIITVPVNDPVPYGYRVQLISNREPEVDIPAEALAVIPVDKSVVRARVRHDAALDKALKVNTKIQPGNVYAAVRARIFAVSKKTPAHRAEQVMRELEEQLVREIRSLPDHCEETFTRRLRHVSMSAIRRSWDSAVQKHGGWMPADAMPVGPAYGIEAVRKGSVSMLKTLVGKALEARADNSGGNILDKKPIHTLVRLPPGVGKTYAALEAVTNDMLPRYRMSYSQPTVELGEEISGRRASKLPKDDYFKSLVRHHKGRAKLCKSEVYGKLAEEYESVGRSPVKPVCGKCPIRDACAWPEQTKDTKSGLVIDQHANIITSDAKLSEETAGVYDVKIVDENPITTYLNQAAKGMPLAELREVSSKTVLRDKQRQPLNIQTSDLRGFRDSALTALEAAELRLNNKLARMVWGSTITLPDGDGGYRSKTRVEWAIDGEKNAQRTYSNAMTDAMKEIEDAHAANKSDAEGTAKLKDAAHQLRVSQWFESLYDAIHHSIHTERGHVWCVKVVTEDGKRCAKVTTSKRWPRIWEKRHGIHMDGTANVDVWRASFHGMDVELVDTPPVNVQPGIYHLMQIADNAYSKRMLIRNKVKVEIIRSALKAAVAKHGKVLFICQKAVRHLFEKYAPEGAHFAHYGALKGLDKYKDVPMIIIVGRASPGDRAVEDATESLHYRNPEISKFLENSDGYMKGKRTIRMADGTAVRINCEKHADPHVNAMLDQLVGAELRQAVGRVRVYDRTEANPVEIIYFGQEDLGLPVHVMGRLVDVDARDTRPEHIIVERGCWGPSVALMRAAHGDVLDGYCDKTVRRVFAACEALVCQRRAKVAQVDKISYIEPPLPSSTILIGKFVHLSHCQPFASDGRQSVETVLVKLAHMRSAEEWRIDKSVHSDVQSAVREWLPSAEIKQRRIRGKRDG